jgi:hypothetical protein
MDFWRHWLDYTVRLSSLDQYVSSCDALIGFIRSFTTRGIHVNGTNNDGVNSHHCSSADDKPLIVLAGVGAESVNETNINIMGDFR